MARMNLASVKTGKLTRPARVLLYGPEGVGKSTFATRAPSPIWLGAEDGTGELDVPRFPEPESWQDILDAIGVLMSEEHAYQTLVIDTLDWVEPMLWDSLCAQHRKDSIEAFGYGKGYALALDHWRSLIRQLDTLRAKREMNIVLLAHSAIRAFHNPTGEDFDRYELKLNQKAAGLWKEWVDAVLFGIYEDFARKDEGARKAKALTSGARIIHTQRHPAWDAKSRYQIPEQLPLNWDDFWHAVSSGTDPSTLKARISEILPSIDEATAKKVSASVTKYETDSAQLARILNKLIAMQNGVAA